MTLLYIYIGTILVYFLGLFCLKLDLEKRVTKKAIKEYKGKDSEFTAIIKTVFVSLTPIINVIFGFMFIFSQELRKRAEEDVRDSIIKNSKETMK